MARNEEFTYYLQQLCSVCYRDNKYYTFKENKCEHCQSRNVNPVYVHARNHSEFVRDFRNVGNSDHGFKVEKCQHSDIDNIYKHAKGCHFAMNDFEFFVWNWMSTNKKFKLSDIFTEFIAPYIYKSRPTPHLNKIPIATQPREYQNMISQIPRSSVENQINKDDNKKKLYFCWFCLKNITSEKEIQKHLSGNDHMLKYDADKKRRWYFKMPKSQKVTLCTEIPCDCLSPHTDDELQEMNTRIKFRNFEFKTLTLEKKEINPWPLKITYKMLMFPNRLECYKNPIRITANMDLNDYTVSYICLRDDESRPFFTLHDNHLTQKGQILRFQSYSEEQFKNFSFDIEFFPICSGTYIQTIEFGVMLQGEEYCCQKLIRADVGTPQHLEQFKTVWAKYNVILKRSNNQNIINYIKLLPGKFKNLEFDTIIPFSIGKLTNNSIMTEDLLRCVFRIVSNLKWIDCRVESWNYCEWMRDMLVHEELEQQLLLSQLLFIGDISISSSFTKECFIPRKDGQLFGTIKFKNECHDCFAREFVVQNINRVFLLSQGLNTNASLYECDLVDKYYYDVESRSVNEVTLCIPESAVKYLQLKHGIVVHNISIIFRYNRLIFERRHRSLDKMPHYDSLSYIPLCCPSFTRFPYGDPQSNVIFKPKLNLNIEQQRLPCLALRKLNEDEIVLPFILNGAFGTGKTSVIAETVRTILYNSKKTRVLICTRSYSAGKVYLKMFSECLLKEYIDKIKLIVSPKKPMEYDQKLFWIYNDNFNMENFKLNRVFITTLDNVTNALSPLQRGTMQKSVMCDYIFVDEAAQVLEVDAISVYQFGNKESKFIFAGDVFQVRPDYYNMNLKKFSVPIVCRLHNMYKNCPDYEICLKQVYRAHPVLVEYLSEAIYMQCDLTSLVTPKYPLLKPMMFNDSNENRDKSEEYDDYFCSYKNEYEVSMIEEAIIRLCICNDMHILICSPFFAQVKLIRDKLKNNEVLREKMFKKKVTVELPSNIQGKEFDAVFISTVLTVNNELKHPIQHPTFHSNKNLINLAISRAKHYVEVIGDKECLLTQPCRKQWKIFLEFCKVV